MLHTAVRRQHQVDIQSVRYPSRPIITPVVPETQDSPSEACRGTKKNGKQRSQRSKQCGVKRIRNRIDGIQEITERPINHVRLQNALGKDWWFRRLAGKGGFYAGVEPGTSSPQFAEMIRP